METKIRDQKTRDGRAELFDSDDDRDDDRFSLSLRRRPNAPADDEDDVISNGYGGLCLRDPRAAFAEVWLWCLGDAR